MRQVDPKIVQERKNRILQAVIHQYIKSARPVGSHNLIDEYHFDLSPATIRNLMAELEEEGFLTHPHTSAGRVPTDKGYRTYVDSLIELQRLAVVEEERIRHEYDWRIQELQDLLVQTSRILSGLSQYSGFVLTPKMERNQLQFLELIQVAESRILAVCVTHTGMVKHKIIEASISRERLLELNRLLNAKLRGLTLGEARQRIQEEVEDAARQERELLLLAQNLSREIFEGADELYVEGTTNVLTLPEFHDYEPMRSILRLSEKDMLMHILESDPRQEGVRVLIGSETEHKEFKELSVVSTVYKDGETPVGILGIVGPKRMEYPRMMALVSAVSAVVNRVLSRKEDPSGTRERKKRAR
jgi:heat-inducible transcriptional repressor